MTDQQQADAPAPQNIFHRLDALEHEVKCLVSRTGWHEHVLYEDAKEQLASALAEVLAALDNLAAHGIDHKYERKLRRDIGKYLDNGVLA